MKKEDDGFFEAEEKEKKRKHGKIDKILGNSPINYFSDLFVVAMVAGWIIALLAMLVMAIYSTIVYADNSIWCEFGTLVGLPLSCGGAMWMVKNCVQHNIAGKQGKECPIDFPAVNDDFEIGEMEKPMTETGESEIDEGEADEGESDEGEADEGDTEEEDSDAAG